MEDKNYDIAILGGGPGGYVAAIRAAQLGFKVTVIEKDKLGGVCLNWGCIPTKALLKNAEIYNHIKHSEEFGINLDNIKFDFKKIIKRSRDVAHRNSKGIEYLFKKNKINHISGFGKIISNGKIEVSKEGKITEVVTAKHIIIATGARPRTIPGINIDGKKIITSTEAMLLTEPPKSMLIIGAGAIGVEFAYFYNTFGTKVTLIEMMPSILPIEDKEITKLLESIFKKSGIEILTNSKVEKASVGDKVRISLSSDGKQNEVEGDLALMAIGVQGNVENIGLDEIGIRYEKSFIKVDEYYRTNIQGIYAIGDVIGPPLLAHVASAEGITCVEAIAGKNPPVVDYDNVPGCTYCQPQVASIGLTEEEANKRGFKLKIGRFPFTASGKARAIGETDGLVKLIFDEKYGELLGAHILGSDATEMIAELGVARTLGTTAQEIMKTIHAHPTLSEAVMEAAADAFGEAIHI
ncbi:MAG: Dihydrolipoamide dehydrogenase of branched-chain alpha-keto acid dehydrogenase [Ignavibacteriae bacterium]|nr:MAG: Dihydrolipoamide dehydrogenase of branched-chain alpha-keto acid dehydrogenase [Ignavibacteriota bacterium]